MKPLALMATHEISADAKAAMKVAAELISGDSRMVGGGISIQRRFEGWRRLWTSRGLGPTDAATVATMRVMLGALSRRDLNEVVKKN